MILWEASPPGWGFLGVFSMIFALADLAEISHEWQLFVYKYYKGKCQIPSKYGTVTTENTYPL